MMPRLRSTLPLLLLASAASLHALTITHTEPRRFDRVPFTSFGELLGFRTTDPTRLALFSDPARREGLFFDVALDTPLKSLPAHTTALVEVLFEGDKAPHEFHFALPELSARAANRNARNLYLGLTDEAFSSLGAPQRSHSPKKSRLHLLAWRISLLDSAQKPLATSASPLWQY